MTSQQDREEGDVQQMGQRDTVYDARQDVNNRLTSPSRLAFITATELPKFKRHRTSSDDIFTKGPEIG